MRVEESKYKHNYIKKVVLAFGNFYFFEKYIIAELNHGIHFNWEKGRELIDVAYEHYGEDAKIAYISNRVNSYSVDPQDWIKFYKERHHLEAYAIVAYNKIGLMNVMLEKLFSQTRIRKFSDLDAAVEWILSLQQKKDEVTKENSSS